MTAMKVVGRTERESWHSLGFQHGFRWVGVQGRTSCTLNVLHVRMQHENDFVGLWQDGRPVIFQRMPPCQEDMGRDRQPSWLHYKYSAVYTSTTQ